MMKKLDLTKLDFADVNISSKEALSDVIPIPWNNDVLTGRRKVIIKR